MIDIKIDGAETQEISPHIHGQFIFNKCAKVTQWGKDSLLTNGAETIG